MVEMMMKRCLQCNTHIRVRVTDHNRGFGKFCSLKCSSVYTGKNRKPKEPNCICAQCNTPIYKNPSKKKNSKSGLYFCNRSCKEKAQRIGGIKEIQPHHYGDGSYSYRDIAFRSYPNQCNRCGYSKCLPVLEVHHKDRDRANNQLENLEILCRNCHGEEHYNSGSII